MAESTKTRLTADEVAQKADEKRFAELAESRRLEEPTVLKLQAEINGLKSDLNRMSAENDKLRVELAEAKQAPRYK